jgi:nucleotide-binding universal stress UspA family protein
MEFRNVLVFTNGRPEGERALQVGAEVARKSGGNLHVLFAAEPPVVVPELEQDLGSALQSGQLEELERLRERARELGVEAQVEARIGRPFVEIVRACLAHDCDLVVKAARGRERMGWPLLGSTALHLVRKAPVPVWLVGEHGEPVPRRVMALLSSDLGSDERQELDRRVLDVAHSVCAAVGGELGVGAAWDAPGEGLLHRRMPAERLQAYVEGSRRQAEEALGRALEPWSRSINPARVHLVRGVPYVELVALAAERADLVVIGTTPPRAGAAFLIREEAEEVINRLDTSIVAVKPAGFESPVGPA